MTRWRWIMGMSLLACGSSAFGKPLTRFSIRPDASTITWYLDRQTADTRQPLLVLAQGSGCTSVISNANVEAAKALLPTAAVLTVEKYGVLKGDAPKAFPQDCRSAYTAHHTISQRVADYRQVISDLRNETWWNGKLILFGGSEGGAVMQILAAQVHPNAAVIFSSATGMRFRRAFIQVLPRSERRTVPENIRKIRKNPNSTQTWLENSYLWWSDIMDRRLSDDAMHAYGTDFLVVQGRRDQSNPVESARKFVKNFHMAGRNNIIYWEFPDYDHSMTDPQGQSHLAEILVRISEWLDRTVNG